MIEFYEDSPTDGAVRLIIKTDIEKEYPFIQAFTDLFVKTSYIFKDHPDDVVDWAYLFTNFAEMVCAYRGYKSMVIKKTIMVSSGAMPTEDPLSRLNDLGQYTEKENWIKVVTQKKTSEG